jgi:cell division protein FtsQ
VARESKKSGAGGTVRGVPKVAPRPAWQKWAGAAGVGLLLVSTGMAALKVRRFVIEDPEFMLSRSRSDSLTIQGLKYTSRSKVMRVFRDDFGHSIYSAPLDERRRRLLGVDWVEDASVSRVWPDRLVVRLQERTPVAYVNFRSGVLLIDAHGALLEQPPQSHFAFPVLSGVREDQTDEERRERVRMLLLFEQEMGYLAKDLSEVDVSDVDNLRVVTQMDKRAVELIMGDTNFAARYQNFVGHYPEIHKHSPEVKIFDLRLDDRITAKE